MYHSVFPVLSAPSFGIHLDWTQHQAEQYVSNYQKEKDSGSHLLGWHGWGQLPVNFGADNSSDLSIVISLSNLCNYSPKLLVPHGVSSVNRKMLSCYLAENTTIAACGLLSGYFPRRFEEYAVRTDARCQAIVTKWSEAELSVSPSRNRYQYPYLAQFSGVIIYKVPRYLPSC